MLDHVFVELLPVVAVVANFFAIKADGQKTLEHFDVRQGFFQLLHAVGESFLQLQHPLAHLHARPQLVEIKRLGDIIIGASLQPGDNVLASVPRSQQNQVSRLVGFDLAGPPADFRSGHARHVPVQNRQRDGGVLLQHSPGLIALFGDDHFVTVFAQSGFQQSAGNPVIISD